MEIDLVTVLGGNKGTLAARLRAFRLSFGMTIDELTAKTGIRGDRFVNLEEGLSEPAPDELARIADFFGTTPEYLALAPGAARDSAEVRSTKAALREYLLHHETFLPTGPQHAAERIALVYEFVTYCLPVHYDADIVAKRMCVPRELFNGILTQPLADFTQAALEPFTVFLFSLTVGIPWRWFYMETPNLVQAETGPHDPPAFRPRWGSSFGPPDLGDF